MTAMKSREDEAAPEMVQSNLVLVGNYSRTLRRSASSSRSSKSSTVSST
jgi:hypothetical protein